MATQQQIQRIAAALAKVLQRADRLGIYVQPYPPEMDEGYSYLVAAHNPGKPLATWVEENEDEEWGVGEPLDLRYGTREDWERLHPKPEPEPVKVKPGTVYYGRRGSQIKIGTTTDMRLRMTQLRFDEILAWEPGTYDVEKQRHEEFGHLRTGRGEWFRAEEDLVAHCGRLRTDHGEPDPKWPIFRA